VPSANYASISGGKPWDAAPLLKAAGVDPEIIKQLQSWGASYTEMAARVQYRGK
jgi:hypothetical protein